MKKEQEQASYADLEKRIAELEKERDFYKHITDNTYDWELFRNAEGKVIYTNDSVERITGYKAEEFLNNKLTHQDFIHPDDLAKVKEKFNNILNHKTEVIDFTYRIVRRDKQVRHVNIYAIPVYQNTKFAGIRSSVRDITHQKDFNQLKNLNKDNLKIIKELKAAKKKVEESQLLFRRLFNSMQEGVYLHEMIWDDNRQPIDYRILDGNPISEKHLEISLEKAKGKKATELYEVTPAPMLEMYANVMKSGEPQIFEQYFEPMKKWFRISAFKVDDEKFATVFYDITENAKAQQEILGHQYRLTEAQKIARMGHWEIHYPENTLIWSDETYRIFKLKPNEIELSLKNFLDLVHPADRQKVTDKYFDHLKNRTDYNVTHRILLKDKSVRYVREKCKTHFNAEGDPVSSIGIIADVTNRIRNEQELKAAKEHAEANELKIRTIIDTVPDMVWLKDKAGTYLMCNKRFESFFGATEEEIVGKTDYDFMDKEKADFFRKNDKIALDAGKPTMNEEKVTFASDGHEEFLETIKTPLFGLNNELVGVLGISRNISQRKKAEEALIEAKNKAKESDQLKSTFLSNMSHEIRTPMNGILGFADLLDSEDLGEEERKRYTKIIQNSGNQLIRIIDDILEISRLETHQVKAIFGDVFLNDMLRELYSIFQLNSDNNSKIELKLKTTLPDQQSYIRTDRTKLSKVLGNLLENAFRYTIAGFIEFGYFTEGKEIVLYVKDTGIGISKDKQKLIFERFRQGDIELSQISGGLGLGLSIAKENTELIGGTISVESERGEGTTFFIRLPYTGAISRTTTEKAPPKPSVKHQSVILVAEDEDINFLYIQTLLNTALKNVKVLHATNGQQAFDLCQKQSNIDLVLMDMKMPIMNGHEATRQIKKNFPHLPVIAQTAYSTPEEVTKAMSAGCDDFISKPIDREKFEKKLHDYIKIDH